jgi:5-methyltetrahydropteroyltriglutamate--homocysteine methyltransferase
MIVPSSAAPGGRFASVHCGRHAAADRARHRVRVREKSPIETAQPKLDCAVLSELPSKTIVLGVLDLGDMTIESSEAVAARVRRALPYVAPERIVLAPDCGMKYLPREVAFGKLAAMAQAAAILRREVAG